MCNLFLDYDPKDLQLQKIEREAIFDKQNILILTPSYIKYRHYKNVLNNLRFFHHCYIIEVTFISTKEPNFKKRQKRFVYSTTVSQYNISCVVSAETHK